MAKERKQTKDTQIAELEAELEQRHVNLSQIRMEHSKKLLEFKETFLRNFNSKNAKLRLSAQKIQELL